MFRTATRLCTAEVLQLLTLIDSPALPASRHALTHFKHASASCEASCSWYCRHVQNRNHCVASDASKDHEQSKPASNKNVALASTVLQQLSVRELCNALEREAQQRIVLHEQELVEMCKAHHAGQDDQQRTQVSITRQALLMAEVLQRLHVIADTWLYSIRLPACRVLPGRNKWSAMRPRLPLQVIDALQTAGIILRFEDKVFIRAEEVADMVLRALPDTSQEAEVRSMPFLAASLYMHFPVALIHARACCPLLHFFLHIALVMLAPAQLAQFGIGISKCCKRCRRVSVKLVKSWHP